jgi:hypothetical protein
MHSSRSRYHPFKLAEACSFVIAGLFMRKSEVPPADVPISSNVFRKYQWMKFRHSVVGLDCSPDSAQESSAADGWSSSQPLAEDRILGAHPRVF